MGNFENFVAEQRLADQRWAARKQDTERLAELRASLKAAGVKVEFRRTEGTYWQGNGFGTAAAKYDLVVNGTVRGSYDGDRGRMDGKVGVGSGVQTWKLRCCKALVAEMVR